MAATKYLSGFVTICALLATIGSPLWAQDGVAGNWQVDWLGDVNEHTPRSVQISLYQAPTIDCADGRMDGCFFDKVVAPDTPWEIRILDQDRAFGVNSMTVDAGAGVVTINHTYYIHGYWGGEEIVALVGANAMTGNWINRDITGESVWQRVQPQISEVIVTNAEGQQHVTQTDLLGPAAVSVVMPWTYDHWRDTQNFPGQRPRFHMTVTGTRLWGHHVAEIPGSPGFEVGEVRYDAAQDSLWFYVAIWPGAAPGDHVLLLDGIPITISLDVPGYPYPPTNIAIAGLTFSGLSGRNGSVVAPLAFTGLGGRNGATVGPLEFTGLSGRNGAAVGALEFTGLGDQVSLTVDESLIFTGWGGDIGDQTTDAVKFTGWGGPLIDLSTNELIFEGWGGTMSGQMTDPLKFRGWGDVAQTGTDN